MFCRQTNEKHNFQGCYPVSTWTFQESGLSLLSHSLFVSCLLDGTVRNIEPCELLQSCSRAFESLVLMEVLSILPFFPPQLVHSPTILALKQIASMKTRKKQLHSIKYSVGMSHRWVSRRRWLVTCLLLVLWIEEWQKLLLYKSFWSYLVVLVLA